MIGGDIPKDQLVWYKNPNANEQDQDNSNKPMYLVSIDNSSTQKVL
jgi:hypothetical protein